MASRHFGRSITEQQRRPSIALLRTPPTRSASPIDPITRRLHQGSLEWGTHMAKMFSAPNAPRVLQTPDAEVGLGSDPALPPLATSASTARAAATRALPAR